MRSRYESYAIGRNWGVLSVNEVREVEDMNRLPGDQGDQYLVPLNMVPADRVDDMLDRNTSQTPNEDDTATRVARASADRLVRYETRRLEKDHHIYGNGELVKKLWEWTGLDIDSSSRYVRVSQQLNLLAAEAGISGEKLFAAKKQYLLSLMNREEVEYDDIIQAIA
jgi:hypothetical protein